MELVSNAQSWAKDASDLSNIGKTLGLNLFIRIDPNSMLVISRIGHTQRVQVFLFHNNFEGCEKPLFEHDMWSCDNPRSCDKF